MPRILLNGQVVMGRTGQTTSVDKQLLSGVDGDIALRPIGAWEGLNGAGDLVGQCECTAPDGTVFYNGYVRHAATGAYTRLREERQSFDFHRAGGGRYALLLGQPRVATDSARTDFSGRFPLAIGDDGSMADVDQASGRGIVLTLADGSIVRRLDGVLSWGNGDDHQSFIRDGVFSDLRESGWSFTNFQTGEDLPYLPVAGISWIVPMRVNGKLYLLERVDDRALTLRESSSPRAFIVAQYSAAEAHFAPDARFIAGRFAVCWSANRGEDPGAFRRADVELSAVEAPPAAVEPVPAVGPPAATEPSQATQVIKVTAKAGSRVVIEINVAE